MPRLAKKHKKFNLTRTMQEMPVGSYIRIAPDEISKFGIKSARHNLYQRGYVFTQRKAAGGYTVLTKLKEPTTPMIL